jgi:hypothetical protein
MADHENLDLQIMLEIVRYVSHRTDSQGGSEVTLTDLLQNLPTGTSIGTVIGAIFQPEGVAMGDSYKIGQAGAVGPGAVGIGNTFSQIWLDKAPQIDLGQLAAELNDLRAAARAASTGDVDQDLALGELASAERAASDQDGPTALSHLRNAGKWILDVAKGIGVPIAVKAIEAALGLPG